MSGYPRPGATDWDPDSYDAFAEQRQRPARDLLAAVPRIDARRITDLGCGSGLSTKLLAGRWPGAEITALDRSTAMLKRARVRVPSAQCVAADIAQLAPDVPQDLLFANASLHWLEDHAALLPRLVRALRPGGVLALQMPTNLDEPSHRLMRETAARPEFAAALEALRGVRPSLLDPARYYDVLSPVCRQLTIWETRYVHALADAASIADWFASTGLKPYLDALAPADRDAFRGAYVKALGGAYTERADGRVLLVVPRLFIIAVRQ